MKSDDSLIEFFRSKNISELNQKITLKYLDSFRDPSEPRSEGTIQINTKIMKFILMHIRTDLDKLTEDDIDDFKRAIGTRVRQKDGKPISDAVKKQYLVGFK